MTDLARCGVLESAVGAQIVLSGRRYVNFGGSSYLGLSSNTEILEAGVAMLRECGAGAPLARDQCSVSRAHQSAETEATMLFDSQAALFLPGGYYFGLVSIAAVREQFNIVFFDELAHYSLREGIAASGLKSYAFRHLDAADLEAKLRAHLNASDKPLVATDGLYSTFGRIAPLDDLWQVVMPYGGRLLVDESHSFGVLGLHGRGAQEHHGIPSSSVLFGGSLSKAFGTCGGIIPASEEEVAAFRRTPVALGAGVGAPAAAAMCAASLRYVRRHPELLQCLRTNVVYMKESLRGLGVEVPDSIAPVAAFTTASPQALKDALMSEGIFVYHSMYLGAGVSGVIRCGIFADHTREHIDQLIDALRRLM